MSNQPVAKVLKAAPAVAEVVTEVEVEPVEVVKPVAVVAPVELVKPVVTNETVRRVNAAIAAPATTAKVVATVPVVEDVLVPAKPEYDLTRKHKEHQRGGHKNDLAVVATERALLDDVERYRTALVGTIDELHTRLSPKYQLDQLKSTWVQAGTDALGILKNEGSPVDETRKKKAETILKAGGGIVGLLGLHGLRKLIKRARLNRSVRHAVTKGIPQEHVELVGVVESLEQPEHRFEDADEIIFGNFNTTD